MLLKKCTHARRNGILACLLLLDFRRRKINLPDTYHINEDRLMKPKRTLERNVTGIIIPQRWDSNGKVNGVSIQAFDEREYIVKPYKRGKELFDFINEKVRVAGKLHEQLDGKVLIEVHQFEILEIHNTV